MKFEFFDTLFASAVSAAVLFLLTKFMGKRQISQLSIFDYINGITIGSIAAQFATSGFSGSLRHITAMSVYAGFSVLLSFISRKSLPLRKLIVGKPIVIFENNRIYEENLKAAKLDINEFLTECRTAGYFDLSKIEAAVFETNGSLSILPKSEDAPATAKDVGAVTEEASLFYNLVIDGRVLEQNLKTLGKNRVWLERELSKAGASQKEIILAVCDSDGKLTVYEKTGKKYEKEVFI